MPSAATKLPAKSSCSTNCSTSRKPLPGWPSPPTARLSVIAGPEPKPPPILGAVAALVRSVGSADYRLPHTGFSFPAGIPAGAVTAEDADLIVHLASQGKVRMHLTLTPQKLPDETGYNVIADLKGVEHPEQIVLVSGHLDSWDLGTGAIDDGAGVVIAMETAEILQRLHLRPARTLRVIAWMDEETGGAGSKAYSTEYSADFAHHIAAIESDAGAAHPLGFDVKAAPAAIDALRPCSLFSRASAPPSSSPALILPALTSRPCPTLESLPLA